MPILRPRPWNLPERLASPEDRVLNRRALLMGGAGLAGGLGLLAWAAPGQAQGEADPSIALYPAERNPAYEPGRPLTPEATATTYNNYYEFGTSKSIWRAAQAKRLRPWEVRIDGLVERPVTLAIDDLLRQVQLEERVYRFRCVEAWGMTVPWTGFPMRRLIEIARPTSAARYLRFESFLNPSVAPGQRAPMFPWPYVEAVTLAEAGHDLAFMATGVYGKPLPKQMGAPIRMVLPWKYGFKSGKAVVRVSFTAERPKSFWEALAPSEYGFWANVNPAVPHPRWSQATERLIDDNRMIPTVIYNGYGPWVADLYKDLQGERLYM